MGIEDGVVLAACLAESSNVDAALERFMQRRFERVRTILEASLTISRAQMEPSGQVQMAAAHRAAAQALSRPY
jgi:2-polyprenyl-6-methoxyphenol hydroxylase-like FAD-dependent oxidoreductase